MTEDRKAELAKMCCLEIRRAVTLAQMSMADYGYHLAMPVFDIEFQSMLDRLEDKPFTEHDIPILIELVMEDLWPRLRAAARSSREYMWEYLIEKNSSVIVRNAEFDMDTGWASLVSDAAERMASYPEAWKVRLDGGKEKFGCLVLHVSFAIKERGATSEIKRMREEFRLRSLATCDICGENGRLRLGGYAKTVCDKHAAVFEGFREDDGQWADPWRWQEKETGMSAIGLDELVPTTAISRQIAGDIRENYGRKADLLVEFVGRMETAVVAAMSVADDDVDFWMQTEVGRWESAQPFSDGDRGFLLPYLRSLAIDERGRRDRLRDGEESLQRFLDDNPGLAGEAAAVVGRERELLNAYAGDLADSARARVVKAESLDGYIREEVALWPDVGELSESDRDWLRHWLRRMIDAEAERIKKRVAGREID
ncbi:hypothetical protein [Rhizobium sp. Root1204]|uniref:hypothetical protein n=1 Tax=Rhizobium sp. Root1204 TaxID=1736428 RepID=UPI0007143E28|nr:hypothetical protein [Rhizobium sp. Root1204]KQV41941.1 hypothetical protein ASC96_00845 [Rhizobium sp. Root1204]